MIQNSYKLLKVLTILIIQESSMASISLVSGLGGSAGFGENSLPRNDDGSTTAINITSLFGGALNFFGQNYSQLYVNNNGSITFGSSLDEFIPFSIKDSNVAIIAPFFADVDTTEGSVVSDGVGTSKGSNLVYYDLDSSKGIFTATWDDVAYYNNGGAPSKTNAFQVQLVNKGSGDFDIRFRYEDVNWVSGDAGDGVDGLGGVLARVGYAAGDLNPAHAFEIPQSAVQDKLLALDEVGQEFVFRVRNGVVLPSNVAPTANNDTASATAGVLLNINVLANDSDYDNDALSISSVTNAAYGQVSINGNAVQYTANAGYAGADSFTYTINDGHGNFSTATFNVNVTVPAIYGSNGAETIIGTGGNDLIFGYGGNDIIIAGAGNDTVNGGIGNDTINGGVGNDILNGDDGNDTLVGDMGDDTLTGGQGQDILNGGAGNDVLDGGIDGDILNGSDGHDILWGRSGQDTLVGEAGNDRLIGGQGSDLLVGGLGADKFVFDADSFVGLDTVADLSFAQGDKLTLSGLLEGYNAVTSAITDFVRITDNGSGGSFLAVDKDGLANGSYFATIARIDGVTGLTDELALLNSGRLEVI
jgi:Ca2+-binding RTX toxin-like protein